MTFKRLKLFMMFILPFLFLFFFLNNFLMPIVVNIELLGSKVKICNGSSKSLNKR